MAFSEMRINEDAPGPFAGIPEMPFPPCILPGGTDFGKPAFITMHEIVDRGQCRHRRQITPGLLRREDPQCTSFPDDGPDGGVKPRGNLPPRPDADVAVMDKLSEEPPPVAKRHMYLLEVVPFKIGEP